jgi:predicted nucleotide-binding protein
VYQLTGSRPRTATPQPARLLPVIRMTPEFTKAIELLLRDDFLQFHQDFQPEAEALKANFNSRGLLRSGAYLGARFELTTKAIAAHAERVIDGMVQLAVAQGDLSQEIETSMCQMLENHFGGLARGMVQSLGEEALRSGIPLDEGHHARRGEAAVSHARLRLERRLAEARVRGQRAMNNPRPDVDGTRAVDPRRVAVVYGRNEFAKEGMFLFLRALDLKPVEWEEAVGGTGKTSPHNKEVLDALFAMTQAVVVLLTADEEARLKEPFRKKPREEQTRQQARPNVLFEAGMAFAVNPDRTLLVRFGEHGEVSDVEGLNYISFDGSSPTRQALRTRLETAGCAVHALGTDWLSAGAEAFTKAQTVMASAALGSTPLSKPAPSEERRRYLNRFAGHSCEVGGQTTYLAWDGPLEDLQTRDPRTTTAAELGVIYEAICSYKPEPLQPMWEFTEGQKGREVYETDEERNWKRKIRSPEANDPRSFLRVIGRSGPCSAYCPLCGRLSGGNYCAPCGSRLGSAVSLKWPQ